MVLSSFTSLGFQLFVLNRARTNRLLAELREVVRAEGLTLSTHEEKRIAAYTTLTAITNHWFSTLRGYKPTKEEISGALYVGAFTPATDDLMDEFNLTYEEILDGAANGKANAVVFRYTWEKLKSLRSHNSQFDHFLSLTLQAQNASLAQQGEDDLSIDHLKELSFNKGGYSTLLYRSVLRNPISEDEQKAIYTLGSMLQLTNDIFDIYKDSKEGAHTLVTRTRNYRFVAKLFDEMELKLKSEFSALDYSDANKSKSYRSTYVVLSRAKVALDQYLKLQGDAAQIDLNHERSKLIVDMEKMSNIFRSIAYTSRANLNPSK
ncbi:MAG: hypothetical protein HWD92_04435 [Flavobacteriia bacterium]|nr:hypothetical protein [Flavobacteriia bacterium]